MAKPFDAQREEMVERQLRDRGIEDERVLAAMASVPREQFVPERGPRPSLRGLGPAARPRADDLAALGRRRDLPGAGAHRRRGRARDRDGLRLLGGRRVAAGPQDLDRRADPGAGRGRRERPRRPGATTTSRWSSADGSRGLPEHSPYGAIAVHAATPDTPLALLDQLDDGGRLVAPVATGELGRADGLRALGRRELLRRPLGPGAVRPPHRRRGLRRLTSTRLSSLASIP